jgi:AraC-like DNA-binding protein
MKEFHRVRRLQHAASLATEHRNPHWARLALGAGYSDQAHLVREFRDLVGVTPVELREERRRLAEAASSIG